MKFMGLFFPIVYIEVVHLTLYFNFYARHILIPLCKSEKVNRFRFAHNDGIGNAEPNHGVST